MTKDTKEFLLRLLDYHLEDEYINWNENDIEANSELAKECVVNLIKAKKELLVDRERNACVKLVYQLMIQNELKRFGYIKEEL